MSESPPPAPQERVGFVARHGWAPYLLVTMTMLFFASNNVIGRAIREDIPPMGLVFWRNLAALAILAPFMLSRPRAELALALRHWRLMLWLGVGQAGSVFIYIGLHTTTAINTSLISATLPAFTVIAAWLLVAERINVRQGVGLVIAFTGVVPIITRGDLGALLALNLVIGDLWVQIAVLGWAMYGALVLRLPTALNPFVAYWAIAVAALVVMAPGYAAELLLTDGRMVFDGVTVVTILYMSVFASILSLVFLNVAIAHIGPVRAGMLFYATPLFTALLAVPFLGESLRLYHLVGATLVLGGVYMTSRARR